MPEMNGYELLQVVKGNARLSKIPFIMLTANTSKDFVIKSLQAKVDDYIVKPYQPQALIDKVKKHLN
jgi:two-component system chemotaxis response regulator CheY